MKTITRLLVIVWLLAGSVGPASAHPVPKGSHDRILTVRVTSEAVTVEYRLEVDLWTVIYEDLPEVEKEGELGKLASPKEFAETFTRLYGAYLAGGLRA